MNNSSQQQSSTQLLQQSMVYLFREQLKVTDELLLKLVTQLVGVEQQGHICLDLAALGDEYYHDHPDLISHVTSVLKQQQLPLVLDNQKLYFDRRYQALTTVANGILNRCHTRPLNWSLFAPIIKQLFHLPDEAGTSNTETVADFDGQLIACCISAMHNFSVISGGPGTGKTRTVTRLISSLLMLRQQQEAANPLTISLAAPTGKAAARMLEAIRKARHDTDIPDAIKPLIPDTAKTIHRLLGYHPQRGFKHHQHNPLLTDILIVDEASMIDLEMMSHLLAALPETSQLILLGDKDQLASVEGGSIFADICDAAMQMEPNKPAAIMQRLYDNSDLEPDKVFQGVTVPLGHTLSVLNKTYRFSDSSQIKQLADWANSQGDSDTGLIESLQGDAVLLGSSDSQAFHKCIIEGYQPYLDSIEQSVPVEMVLDNFEQFRLLTATREKSLGVKRLNLLCQQLLQQQRLISQSDQQWYVGRPVMIIENNYHLGLYNGDIGICLREPESGQLKVHFRLADNTIKVLSPARVPQHDTAFAMTIHKSQGSEFEHVLLIVQEVEANLLTKELLYTGITRAKQQLTVVSDGGILRAAASRKVSRDSGLQEKLLQS